MTTPERPLWTNEVVAVTGVVFVLALTNFDALLGSTPDDPLRWILPGLIVAAAVIGLIYGLLLKRTRPEVYAMVGRGGDSA